MPSPKRDATTGAVVSNFPALLIRVVFKFGFAVFVPKTFAVAYAWQIHAFANVHACRPNTLHFQVPCNQSGLFSEFIFAKGAEWSIVVGNETSFWSGGISEVSSIFSCNLAENKAKPAIPLLFRRVCTHDGAESL